MALTPGTELGPYVITGSLGTGGMGEVYLARDSRLDRDVAIKILPPHLSENTELLQRFRREAKILAGLSHPNICTLHDVGQVGDLRFLIMEHIEGESLAARLARKALTHDEALEIGQQLCAALDRAHRHGIVHRDLKPANIMLTKSGAKLLDFGLARPLLALSRDDVLDEATAPLELTRQDTIVGTLHYMSPEQVNGQPADHRSDVFALGAVLYEMLSGHKAFRGESQAEVMSAILSSEPEPLDTSPALTRAMARCLSKNAEVRWQSTRDLQLELEWIASGGEDNVRVQPTSRWRAYSGWIVVLIVIIASFVMMSRTNTPTAIDPAPARLSLALPDASFGCQASVSPDGRWIAISTYVDGQYGLWLRALDSSQARRLDRTDGARHPFWSPDSQSVGFFAGGKLKTIPVSGGATRTLCDVPGPFTLGSWGANGTILFNVLEAPGQNGIHRVLEQGGPSELLELTDSAGRAPQLVTWPHFLPNGEDFLLFCAFDSDTGREEPSISVAALTTGRIESLVQVTDIGARAEYAATGQLLYTRDRTLYARAFDPDRHEFSGEAVELVTRIEAEGPVGLDSFSVSNTGVLLYEEEGGRGQLVWKDRNGRTLGLIAEPAYYRDLRLGPDAQRLAVSIIDPATNNGDIWIHDLERDIATRFTLGPTDDTCALWGLDGQMIVFSSADDAPPFLHQQSLAGGGAEVMIPSRGTLQAPLCWTSDGSGLLFNDRSPETGWDIWLLPQPDGIEPEPVLQTPDSELFADLSPNDRWLAYSSDESGQYEIYVRPYRRSGAKQRISTAGGLAPRWRSDGAELFYVDLAGLLVTTSITIDSTGRLIAGRPEPLFSMADNPLEFNPYDVTPDGERFVTAIAADGPAAVPTVMVNWTSLMSGSNRGR